MDRHANTEVRKTPSLMTGAIAGDGLAANARRPDVVPTSDTITLEFLGAALRAIQAEQRTLRMENELIRKEIARLASRDELLEVLRVLADRIGNFEAGMEARFDQLAGQLARIAGPTAKPGPET